MVDQPFVNVTIKVNASLGIRSRHRDGNTSFVHHHAVATSPLPVIKTSPVPIPTKTVSHQCRNNAFYRSQLAKKSTVPVNKHQTMCKWDKEDVEYFQDGKPAGTRSYIVVNEPRTGSSWLQEVSYYHNSIKVQVKLASNMFSQIAS